MNTEGNVKVILEMFQAIEQRDQRKAQELFAPELELHWPPSLPYGGIQTLDTTGPTWGQSWVPLQPTEAERRLEPRVVAVGGDEVVVLWRQRGIAPGGERFDGEVLALYKLRDGRVARGQMFYFDPVAAASFLAKATVKMGRG